MHIFKWGTKSGIMNKWGGQVFHLILVLFVIGCSDSVNIDNPNQPNIVFQRDTVDDSHTDFYQMSILTKDAETVIDSKDVYVDSVSIALYDVDGLMSFDGYGKMKGRGNATWTHSPKKPYILKLYEKASLVNLPKDKSWVLLANYFDPTQLRNSVAFFISRKISYLDYTPHFSFVDLVFNGKPQGIYQLGEKLKIGKNRVSVGDDGYLLEVDYKQKDKDPVFSVEHHPTDNVINIKDPDVEVGDDKFNYIKEYILKAEEVCYSEHFLDEQEGWRNYLDETSFVDWYLINEIAKNFDAHMGTSCYMNLSKGGKLKMGPVWDFDGAFGNYNFLSKEINDEVNATSGLHNINDSWIYERLFLDPLFVNNLKSRFVEFYNNRSYIYEYIDLRAAKVVDHIILDNQLWGKVCDANVSDKEVQIAYLKQVEFLKNWLETRFQWLYSYYSDQDN